MYVDFTQYCKDKYDSLASADKKLLDYVLYQALGWGQAHICSSCLHKYLLSSIDIYPTHRHIIISEDYIVKRHVGESEICEIDTCCNEAEYDIQVNDKTII